MPSATSRITPVQETLYNRCYSEARGVGLQGRASRNGATPGALRREARLRRWQIRWHVRHCHGNLAIMRGNASEPLRPNLLRWALDADFLGDRMSLIAGPRQIGKTTMVQAHLASVGHSSRYFNWDAPAVRSAWRRDPAFFADGLVPGRAPVPVVFDELHKMPRWKNMLKGLHDEWRGRVRFVVTGSARLDFLRRSGDSLVGRYFLFRKLPLHPRECAASVADVPGWLPTRPLEPSDSVPQDFASACAALIETTGFPEPFLSGSSQFRTRWQSEHLSLLLTEDLRDLTRIEQVLRLEDLVELLRSRVGSTVSTENLASNLSASFGTVRRWLDALSLVYLTFDVPPFATRVARAIRKQPKIYFWDWSIPDDPGARFENFIAVQLQRAIASWNERGLGRFALAFVRTRDGVECDFVVTDARRPVLLVEAKRNDGEFAPSMFSVRRWLGGIPAVQVVERSGVLRPHAERDVWVMSADRFLLATP